MYASAPPHLLVKYGDGFTSVFPALGHRNDCASGLFYLQSSGSLVLTHQLSDPKGERLSMFLEQTVSERGVED